jgi:ribosomal protein L40E
MDTDIGHLTMVNKEKAAEEICPKCHAAYRPGAKECPNCGVIFNRVKSSPSVSQADIRAIPKPQSTTGNQKISNEFDKRKKLLGILIFLCIVGAGFYYLYVTQIESRIQAGGFQAQLDAFCTQEISELHLNRVAEGEDPFRTGRVLVVSEQQAVTLMSVSSGKPYTMVLEQGIHPAWHKLDRRIRAEDPSEVDTLIRVHKIIGKSGRYGKLKTKVFNTHKIVLDVYDWKNQTFIGTKIFDPGEGSAFMTDEDYDAMVASVSDQAIAEYIQSMDLRQRNAM